MSQEIHQQEFGRNSDLNRFTVEADLRYSCGEIMSANPTKKLFNVYEYHQMEDAGILSERERLELIYGEILIKAVAGPPHNASVARVNREMGRIVGDRAIVFIQSSVRLNDWNEPEPDVVLLHPKEDFYASKHPGPDDIFLVVEVADSSLKFDLGTKARLYAETGVVEYWIVDIPNDCLFAYSDIHEGTYRTIRQLRRGDTIAPILLPECTIAIDSLLP
jgi:Uma2 family endonuclease